MLLPLLEGSKEAVLILNELTGEILHGNGHAISIFDTIAADSEIAICVLLGNGEEWTSFASRLNVGELRIEVLSINDREFQSRLVKCMPFSDGCGEAYVVAYLENTESSTAVNVAETLERLQATIDASFDAMFTIDETGTIKVTNKAAVRIFGYNDTKELLGENISIICGGVHRDRHNTYLQQYFKTGITKIMGKKRTVKARRRDGSEFSVELGISELPPLSNYACGSKRLFSAFVRDLSQIEQHQAEIQQREQLTQGLVDASFDPMFQIDQHGIIRVINDAAKNLFGYSEEELIGANVSILCGQEHACHHDGYIQRYLETRQKHVIDRKRPTKARRKDGTEFDIELGVREVHLDSGELAFCGFIRDLTQQNLMKANIRMQAGLIRDRFFDLPDDELTPGVETTDGLSARELRRRRRVPAASANF